MDKIYKGLIAGLIAAIIKNLINLLTYFLNLTEVKFLEWGSIIMIGQRPFSFNEMIYGFTIHVLWTGFLGIIFCYLIPYISTSGLIIKGGLYAFLLTFIFRAIVNLYGVGFLSQVSVQTSFMNTLTAFIWGIIMAYLLINYFNIHQEL